MLTLGPKCRIIGMRPELNLAFIVINSIIKNIEMTITHVTDGTHSRASIHYAGGAADLVFISQISKEEKRYFYDRCKKALGQDFDLVFEDIGEPNEHWHCEYQPKSAY